MTALLAFLVNLLRVMLFVHAGKIVVGVLGFLGLQYLTFEYAIGPGLQFINDLMATGPGGEFGTYAMNWLGILRLDQAVSMLLSAWAIRAAINSTRGALMRVTS